MEKFRKGISHFINFLLPVYKKEHTWTEIIIGFIILGIIIFAGLFTTRFFN